MFLVGSKSKYNIDAVFEIPISPLNKNAKHSFIHISMQLKTMS